MTFKASRLAPKSKKRIRPAGSPAPKRGPVAGPRAAHTAPSGGSYAQQPAEPALPNSQLLQPLSWPEPALCSEQDLYFRAHGPSGVSLQAQKIHFSKGAHLQFNTYFNLFNVGKWYTHCGLKTIGLQLAGRGTVELTVFLAFPDRSWGRLVNEVVDLSPDRAQRFEMDLTPYAPEQGILFFEVKTLSDGLLNWAAWDTTQAPRRTPDLALAVTTFRREDAVAETVERFRAFMAKSKLRNHLHMIVVDNGRSAGIQSDSHVTAIDNENLGGAGGFSRGLLAARERGHSHCLFTDDDAATPMDAFERTWTFLAYARDPGTAVAGAMISTRHAWALWENGATFDGACKPLYGGTDLRDQAQVFDMEFASTPRNPHNFYGGWWYFAFPVDEVKHMPFPFFVRGDDVSFSLAHDFNIVTLPGVVSFQESFTEKDSPLTWYLDLRSHLAHHLSLPSMDIGKRGTARIALWFWARTLIPHHYETMAAINLALEDVMRGPEFFAENADMAARRGQIGALRKIEAWQAMPEPPAERRWLNPHRSWQRGLMKITLNGHLLPFFSRFGNRVTVPAEKRWNPREIWGAAQITYRNEANGQAYTVTHSKWRALSESLKTYRLMRQFWKDYDSLKDRWQKAYPELTGTGFWQGALKLDGAGADTVPANTDIKAAGPVPASETSDDGNRLTKAAE
ncbi:glycosyltransferase [uncultured Tateyamaria sp.]|uniref:glycosyltransferase n=1 Tax=uncultured Tateyamaria sp. TaxID=455651 RepID=UPI0026325CF6|nr:glycosyltransferase [uncultured Tateyamaria sp.]